jgi:hypothetical protein
MTNRQNNIRDVVLKFRGIQVLTPVVMESIMFRDVTPCSPLKVNRCFGGLSTDYTAFKVQGRFKIPEKILYILSHT